MASEAEQFISAQDLRTISSLRNKLHLPADYADFGRAKELLAEVRTLEQHLMSLIQHGTPPEDSEKLASRDAVIREMEEFMGRNLSFGETITRKTIHDGHRN